ncbi:MAG: NADH-quinone oxidoreductase subunit C [Planctomycetes bacterium]|nr:NADH-quinone oxidoreductase subunit C [Planctomycetota bacterium]
MAADAKVILRNGQDVAVEAIPDLGIDEFRRQVIDGVARGKRVVAFLGRPDTAESGAIRLVAVLAADGTSQLFPLSTRVERQYPALTPDCPQAHWFEREIAEQWDVRPQGHPWLKPIRFHAPYARAAEVFGGPGQGTLCGVTDFFRVEGDEVHEVAVGPVHAGVIEPGHFRFQCHGEDVLHLEISLGYQHRGVEPSLVGGPDARTLHTVETLAGDTTIGHATAYCQALESLAGVRVPARAQSIRGIALELERLACHIGDLGALAGDVGFLPTASYCGRIRGDALNVTAQICGSRFGRGLLRPGGVRFDVEPARADDLLRRLDAIARDTASAVGLLWDKPSVMARFEETGVLSAETARQIGLVGPAARACGLGLDVRHDHPAGIFSFAHVPVATWHTGDVFARAYVRWLEVQRSVEFVRDQLRSLPEGQVSVPMRPLAPGRAVVTLVEGWRGEICHVATTDAAGRLAHYKVTDPSLHNWFGLALALRGQQISDFPLCNKSFNLSYCGHDL